jgi:mannitol 2-dehydrogenase
VSDSIPRLAIKTSSLDDIALRGVQVPTYDRTALRPRIVHVGVGGFHRAHMALYTDDLAARGSTWGIRGLGLLPSDERMAAALNGQDCLYTLTEKGLDTRRSQIIGSIIDYALAASDPAVARAAIADPEVAIVSLTITEAGYAEPVSGAQRATFDVLADCLEARRVRGADPVTILSCDNLPGNGDVAKRAMLAAAARHSDTLHTWVRDSCSFPNSMVDRITPVTADADRNWLHETYGVDDLWPVVGEPFRQWVIEDDFVAGRPAWEDVGVLFTDDVHAWELYKLRMLNAGHSCIAYLCALAGIVYVDEAMDIPEVAAYLTGLLQLEALPTLVEIPGHPRQDYITSVLGRFANTGVRDQIARLCIDGTAKFPTFLIPTIARQLELGGPIQRAALALAGWARYLAVTPLAEQSFDASGDLTRPLAVAALADPTVFLGLTGVFPERLANNERFRTAFVAASALLEETDPIYAMMSTTSEY